jgi:hypothetical protein
MKIKTESSSILTEFFLFCFLILSSYPFVLARDFFRNCVEEEQ